MNVVPNELTIGFDIRITPSTNIVDFENQLRKWMEEVFILNDLNCLKRFLILY